MKIALCACTVQLALLVGINWYHTCACIFTCVLYNLLYPQYHSLTAPLYMYFYSAQNISYKGDRFFDDEVEYERGYQCLASTDHDLNNLTDSRITAKVTVRDFRVQAFDFKTPGEFGNCE